MRPFSGELSYILSSYFLVPENVAMMFNNFVAKLREAVNPDDISAQLLANDVITNNEKAEIDLPSCTTQARMDKLLAAVQRAIHISPQNYETFLVILDKNRKYSPLVQEMRGKVAFSRLLGNHGTAVYYYTFSHSYTCSSFVQR